MPHSLSKIFHCNVISSFLLFYVVPLEINISFVSVPDGKPVIGSVPDLPNVLIATGHEGSGLALVRAMYKSAPVSSFVSYYLCS
jgi:hypothetical protein